MTFPSRELYKQLRANLDPAFLSQGFKRAKSGLAAWSRPQGSESLLIWFQCDKYGWEKLWGSQFTMEFQLATDAQPGSGSIFHRARYYHLLNTSERGELQERNNAVIASLPGTQKNASVSVLDPAGNEVVIMGFRTTAVPYHSGEDIWMHYYTAQDIQAWSLFLALRLEALGERFIQEQARAA